MNIFDWDEKWVKGTTSWRKEGWMVMMMIMMGLLTREGGRRVMKNTHVTYSWGWQKGRSQQVSRVVDDDVVVAWCVVLIR